MSDVGFGTRKETVILSIVLFIIGICFRAISPDPIWQFPIFLGAIILSLPVLGIFLDYYSRSSRRIE